VPGALYVDVGALQTTVVLADARGPLAAATFPLAGSALETSLRTELGVDEELARSALVAHSAGAGHRSAVGPGTAHTIRRLAERHADVWLDALETACAELSRGHDLPAQIWLGGGGATLPELRDALARRGWHVTLPFARPPTAALLTPDAVGGITLAASHLPALQVVPPLAAAAHVVRGLFRRPAT
jgi:hypothetical protein